MYSGLDKFIVKLFDANAISTESESKLLLRHHFNFVSVLCHNSAIKHPQDGKQTVTSFLEHLWCPGLRECFQLAVALLA